MKVRALALWWATALVAGTTFFVAGTVFGAEPEAWPPIFQDTTEVRVVNVDVVVTDGRGNTVDGLVKDDFVLLVDGREVEVSNFYAVSWGDPVAPPEDVAAAFESRRLFIAVFIDNVHLVAADRSRLFARLRELVSDFLSEVGRKDTRIMLVSHDRPAAGRPVVHQGFTASPRKILAALDELAKKSASGRQLRAEEDQIVDAIEAVGQSFGNRLILPGSDTPEAAREEILSRYLADIQNIMPMIDAYAQERNEDARRAVSVLGQVVDMLAPLPGRKVVVQVSNGLPVRAGEMLYEAFETRFANILESAPSFIRTSGSHRFDLSRDLDALTDRANASGVTFYTINPSLQSVVDLGDVTRQTSFKSGGLSALEEGNYQGSQVVLANATGGRSGFQAGLIEDTLESVFDDFDNHYSLGYQADPGAGDARRSIEVRLRRPERFAGQLELRYRESYRPKDAEERMHDRVLSTLATGLDENPLGIALRTTPSKPGEDGTFVVPLLVEVPLGQVVLVPGKSEHEARVSMYVAARDERGRVSEVTRHLCPIRIKNAEILTALGRKMACGVRLGLLRGRQQVAVAVRDELAGTEASLRLEIEVPLEVGVNIAPETP